MNDLRLVGARAAVAAPQAGRTRTAARPICGARCGGRCAPAANPCERAFLTSGERTRRLVLLLDVSGSMEPYARAFVRFLHAAVVSRSRVEAFALGTRLTRVTRELTSRDPDAAVRAAARRVVDWSGGTRLGEGVRAVQRRVGDSRAWRAARSS